MGLHEPRAVPGTCRSVPGTARHVPCTGRSIIVGAVGWLVPVIGWFIVGPLLWFGGLALCFRALERFGRGARSLLPAATADEGALDARAAGGSA